MTLYCLTHIEQGDATAHLFLSDQELEPRQAAAQLGIDLVVDTQAVHLVLAKVKGNPKVMVTDVPILGIKQ
jgi:hypothetical protein